MVASGGVSPVPAALSVSFALRKEHPFATSDRNAKDSIEARISDVLWQWRFADLADRDRITTDSRLALLLEFWFPFDEITLTRGLGTWCDGSTAYSKGHQSNRLRNGWRGLFPTPVFAVPTGVPLQTGEIDLRQEL